MAKKKYVADLTAEERTTRGQLLQKGTSSARNLPRARTLLQAEEGLRDEESATALGLGIAPVERAPALCRDGSGGAQCASPPRGPGQSEGQAGSPSDCSCVYARPE